GRRIGRDLGERCITVKADQLRRIPEVVAIAGGQRKGPAIDAVLRSGLVTSLVTDTSAADYLLAAGPAPKPALNRSDPDGVCRPVARAAGPCRSRRGGVGPGGPGAVRRFLQWGAGQGWTM